MPRRWSDLPLYLKETVHHENLFHLLKSNFAIVFALTNDWATYSGHERTGRNGSIENSEGANVCNDVGMICLSSERRDMLFGLY